MFNIRDLWMVYDSALLWYIKVLQENIIGMVRNRTLEQNISTEQNIGTEH